MFNPLITAIRTLTILPVPGKDTDSFPKSIVFFPVAGLIISALLYVVYMVCCYIPGEITLLRGVLFTLAMIVLTGGLHLDGFADAADGFLGGKDKESVLRILKDSRIGTFGGTAIVFDLAFRILLSDYLISNSLFLPFVLSIVNSRIIQGLLLSIIPNARGTEGKASPFSGAKHLVPVLLLILILVNAGTFFVIKSFTLMSSLLIAGVVTMLLSYYFQKRIGGITGDCVGAATEIFEITFLLSWCLTL